MNKDSKEPDYSYLDLLNPQQRAAVSYHNGPSLVIAGAGSGKTRVLTYKIVDLLAHGFEPYRILALTFTNKAAREMKERVAAAAGIPAASKIWMGTFHSVFLRILRSHADLLGFRHDFTIYDAADSRALIKTIIKDLELDDKAYKPAVIASIISNAKNALVYPEQYRTDRSCMEADRVAKRPRTAEIFSLYVKRCKKASAMDFDDILYYMNLLLRDYPEICRHYQEFFRYILVDEYQDTNFAQHLIITRLAGESRMVCVVGDDAQSIYSFRGANISNILNLDRSFPGLKIFKLERNYRSTQNIINAAGSLIAKNSRQMKKNVYSENEPGELIEVIGTYSDMEEAYLIANKITQRQLTAHDSLDNYAVLYRTNAQSRQLEESLRKRNIPYRIYGGLSFYQRKEVKDVICYFRLSVNPDDDEALRRVINYPARGIGETTLKKLTAAAMERDLSLWDVICDPVAAGVQANAGTIKKLTAFRDLIKLFNDDNSKGSDAFELGQLIYNRTGILTQLAHDNTPEAISRQENLAEMLSSLHDFVDNRTEAGEADCSMSAFLSEVSLATDQDSNDENNEPKVTLMTVHAAKGLEFSHVFIVGVEEELFPSAMSMDSFEQIEEERRLLYVAITRAKKTCVISFANSRFRNGQTVMTRPSRFLSDIDHKYLRIVDSSAIAQTSASFINPVANYRSRNSFPTGMYGSKNFSSSRKPDTRREQASAHNPITGSSDNARTHNEDELSEGQIIRHTRFGRGKITGISELSGEPMILVHFDQMGDKKLLLKFARFTIEQ